MPTVTWISGLFNPQAFLTAVMQVELGHGGIEAGPAFLAFSRTENWGAYDHTTPTGPGHPNWGLPDSGGRTGGPLPDSFVHDQWAMQKKIVARQRELGIGSVLPAFQASTNAHTALLTGLRFSHTGAAVLQGNVPRALHELYPTANISSDARGGRIRSASGLYIRGRGTISSCR